MTIGCLLIWFRFERFACLLIAVDACVGCVCWCSVDVCEWYCIGYLCGFRVVGLQIIRLFVLDCVVSRS